MRIIDWLGSLRAANDDISSDALRIASLEAENETLKADNKKLSNKISVLEIAVGVLKIANKELRGSNAAAQPLVAYANRQKANRARYDAKRRGK